MNERGGAIIEARSLKKVYGNTTAVDGIGFQVKPGRVTGFLGPNGAGKSTTMRMILGLDLPTSGTVTVGRARLPGQGVAAARGRRAARCSRPAPGPVARTTTCSASPRPTALPASGSTRCSRWSGCLGGAQAGRRFLPGHVAAARHRRRAARRPGHAVVRRAGQRARPGGHLLDQDADGSLAAQGRTVLVSSHLMSEMALTADHLLVIGRGRLLADMPVGADRRELRRAGRGPRRRPALGCSGPARRRCPGHARAGRHARRARARVEADRRAGRRARPRPASAARCDRVAGGGLLPADRRERRYRAPVPVAS